MTKKKEQESKAEVPKKNVNLKSSKPKKIASVAEIKENNTPV